MTPNLFPGQKMAREEKVGFALLSGCRAVWRRPLIRPQIHPSWPKNGLANRLTLNLMLDRFERADPSEGWGWG